MRVRDLMQTDVLTVDENMSLGRLLDLMTAAHIHAAPVVGPDGQLVGMVSLEDILVGGLGDAAAETEGQLTVADVMTSPAMGVTADATIPSVARMMWRFRIHHVPVVGDDESVQGIVSSLDFCRHVGGVAPAEDEIEAGEDDDA